MEARPAVMAMAMAAAIDANLFIFLFLSDLFLVVSFSSLHKVGTQSRTARDQHHSLNGLLKIGGPGDRRRQ